MYLEFGFQVVSLCFQIVDFVHVVPGKENTDLYYIYNINFRGYTEKNVDKIAHL